MLRKIMIGQGLGRISSALLADGLGTSLEQEEALNIEIIGIVSVEAFGRLKIRWVEPTYALSGLRQIYIPRPIEIRLKGVGSIEVFGHPEIRLNFNIQGIELMKAFGQFGIRLNLKPRYIWSIEKFGKPIIIADREFIENLEEEETLTLFLLAA